MKLEKLFCMNVAAQLAGAVVSNLPDDLKTDVEIKDPNLRAENLMAWELFRVFYHAVGKAFDDEQNWPAPKSAVNLGGLLETAAAFLPQGLETLAPLIREFLDQLRGPTAPPPDGLPDPGATPPRAA